MPPSGQSCLAPNECQEFKNVYHRGGGVIKRAGINVQADDWQANDDHGIRSMISVDGYAPLIVVHLGDSDGDEVFELNLTTEIDTSLWNNNSGFIRQVFIPYHDCIYAMRQGGSGKVYKPDGSPGGITRDQGIEVPSSVSSTAAAISGTELEIGDYYYKTTARYEPYGEGNPTTTPKGPITTSSGIQRIRLSTFPALDSDWATGRRIYRTLVDAGSDGPYYFVEEIAASVVSNWTDTTPDDELSATTPPTDHDAPPTHVGTAALFRDRLWFAQFTSANQETNEIYYSNAFYPDIVPSTNKVGVPFKFITHLEWFYEMLLAFGHHECYAITGYDPGSFSGHWISDSIGALPYGKPTAHFPGGLAVCSAYSAYVFDGSSFTDIGEPIRDQIQDLAMGTDLRTCWFHYFDEKLFLSLSSGTQTAIHFVYDLRTHCWSETTVDTNAACSILEGLSGQPVGEKWFLSGSRTSDEIYRNEQYDKNTDPGGADIPWEIKTGWHDLGMECDFRMARVVTDPTHDYDEFNKNLMDIVLYVDDQTVKAATDVQGKDGIFLVDMKGITGRKVMVRLYGEDDVLWVINAIDILFEPSQEEEAVLRA